MPQRHVDVALGIQIQRTVPLQVHRSADAEVRVLRRHRQALYADHIVRQRQLDGTIAVNRDLLHCYRERVRLQRAFERAWMAQRSTDAAVSRSEEHTSEL